MNNQFLLVFDFETDSKDPNSCNITQIGAVPMEPRKLKILEDEAFSIYVRPEGIDDEDYLNQDRLETLQWRSKVSGKSIDQILEEWKQGIDERVAWEDFIKYSKNYHSRKTRGNWYTEPIPCGFNIINFDLIIMKRLNEKYKTKFPLSLVQKIDIYDLIFTWFENLQEPGRLSMDALRDFFKIESDGDLHDAKTDVYDEARMLQKFLLFQRKQASVKKFKGAFKNGRDEPENRVSRKESYGRENGDTSKYHNATSEGCAEPSRSS